MAALGPVARRSARAGIDPFLVGAVMTIATLGVLMVYSSTRRGLELDGGDPQALLKRQLLWVVVGVVVMYLATLVDYRVLRDLAAPGYAATLVVLAGLLVLGASKRGAQAWIDLGPFQFQPSEFAKVGIIVVLAAYCAEHRGDIDAWRLGVAVALVGVPLGMVLLQPDLGTGLVFVAILLTVSLVAGARPAHVAVLAVCGISAFATLWWSRVLPEYQVERLTSFLDQSASPTDAAFNVRQSKIAIGAGGVVGKGWGKGTQTGLEFVPEQHTDFIFTAVGEELGFLGGSALLGLLGVVVWRVWRTALLAKDFFGMLVCVGVLAMLAFQIFENVGMTMGVMPITGIPLPFMSYGGSSVIASFAAIGLVLNVSMRRYS